MNQINQFICDTCEKPNPGWLYHTKHFKSPLVPDSKLVIAGWAACDECRALIDARDLEGIIDRAVLARADPADAGDIARQRRISGKIYPVLFENIVGRPVPFTEEASAAVAAEYIGGFT